MSRASVAATFAALALVVVGAAAPAAAQSLHWTDAAGDMWSLEKQAIAPAEANGDIRQVAIHHRSGAVVIRVAYAALDPVEGGMSPINGAIRTNEGLYRWINVRWNGYTHRAEIWTRNSDREIRCDDSTQLDWDAEFAKLRIPRSCLSGPTWVRVYLEASVDDDTSSDTFYDDGMDAGEPDETNMTFTRRIYRD